MSQTSDMRRLIRLARSQGWQVERYKSRRSHHLRFIAPDGAVVFSRGLQSGADKRGIANLRADLRRRGLEVN